MEVMGYRRQRIISQLTFESCFVWSFFLGLFFYGSQKKKKKIKNKNDNKTKKTKKTVPQIILQVRILNSSAAKDLQINTLQIVISLIFAALHTIIEGTMLILESRWVIFYLCWNINV